MKKRFEDLKTEENVLLLKPSPKKKMESPKQGKLPKLTSSKLASTKWRLTSSNGSLMDSGTLKKKNNANRRDFSSTSRIEVDYEAIEKERQRELLVS